MTELNDQFRRLQLAGLEIATTLMASLTDAQQCTVVRALQGGARLSLELGPVPELERLALVLTETEGARHQLTTAEVRKVLNQ